jgi:hypothetical protein
MPHLSIPLQEPVRSRLDPVVHAMPQSLGGRPFQHYLSPRIALDGSTRFIISTNA